MTENIIGWQHQWNHLSHLTAWNGSWKQQPITEQKWSGPWFGDGGACQTDRGFILFHLNKTAGVAIARLNNSSEEPAFVQGRQGDLKMQTHTEQDGNCCHNEQGQTDKSRMETFNLVVVV